MSIVVVSPTRGGPGWVMAIAGEPAPDPPRRLRRAPAPALNRMELTIEDRSGGINHPPVTAQMRAGSSVRAD